HLSAQRDLALLVDELARLERRCSAAEQRRVKEEHREAGGDRKRDDEPGRVTPRHERSLAARLRRSRASTAFVTTCHLLCVAALTDASRECIACSGAACPCVTRRPCARARRSVVRARGTRAPGRAGRATPR